MLSAALPLFGVPSRLEPASMKRGRLLAMADGSAAPAEGRTSASAIQADQPLRFSCLLLDHDDTTVRGTEEVHYPAHVESVRILRPDLEPVSLAGWFAKNHDPGVSTYLRSLFTEDQMVQEHKIWESAIAGAVPSFYEGMPELLASFRRRGGKIAVISHSPAEAIKRHYEAHPMAELIRPDLILGWDPRPERRKPSAWPALVALKELGVRAEEALLLDDLSPGVRMAQAVGVATAAAGWGHAVPVIQEFMQRECHYYFTSVEEVSRFLLGTAPEATASSRSSL